MGPGIDVLDGVYMPQEEGAVLGVIAPTGPLVSMVYLFSDPLMTHD